VDLGENDWAAPGLVTSLRKARLNGHRRQIDVQALTDVNNMLFKILATPDHLLIVIDPNHQVPITRIERSHPPSQRASRHACVLYNHTLTHHRRISRLSRPTNREQVACYH
jgi:hypothetical protein